MNILWGNEQKYIVVQAQQSWSRGHLHPTPSMTRDLQCVLPNSTQFLRLNFQYFPYFCFFSIEWTMTNANLGPNGGMGGIGEINLFRRVGKWWFIKSAFLQHNFVFPSPSAESGQFSGSPIPLPKGLWCSLGQFGCSVLSLSIPLNYKVPFIGS